MFEQFRKRMNNMSGMTDVLNNQSKEIIDKTFNRDITYRKAYVSTGEPVRGDTPIDVKFFEKTKASMSNVQTDFYVQFRPHVNVNIGDYIHLPDADGTYHWWIIYNKDEKVITPFYYVLKCNWWAVWKDGDDYLSCLGVCKSRNSYNSGIWTADTFTTPEKQAEIWLPTTNVTRRLTYNRDIVLSNNPIHPIIYDISNISDMLPMGITKATLYQKQLHEIKDEKLVALTFELNGIEYAPMQQKNGMVEITHTGKPQIMMGGSAKTFNAKYYDGDGNELAGVVTSWDVKLPNGKEDCFTSVVDGNSIKLKCISYYDLTGADIITLTATGSNGDIKQIEIKVVG